MVFLSCHVVELALLSIAMIALSLIVCCSIVSNLVTYSSMGFCLSKYMLASMNAVLPLVTSSVIVSSSENCDISVASTFLFVIITAFLLLASPAVNIFYFVSILAALLCGCTAPVCLLYQIYCLLCISIALLLPLSCVAD